jgi:xanthine dehydrogenase FAD-binding subunit
LYNIQDYYEAETVEDALCHLAEHPEFKLIAGGTDILIKMHSGQIERAKLLSLRNVEKLKKVRKLADGTVEIGALVTFSQISKDSILEETIPLIQEAAGNIGGPQIRNIATLGGNICNGATSADSAPSLLVLKASLKLESLSGDRIIPIEEFYAGPGKVNMQPGEILTHILIPPTSYEGLGGHMIKFAMRKAMDIATISVAVVCKITQDQDKVITQNNVFETVRIALGVAGPTPLRCYEAENYAKGKEPSSETLAEIGRLAVQSMNARTSWRASQEYREHLVEELTQRALIVAITRAGG